VGRTHATARIHHDSRRCGGYVATRGPSAATGEDAADRFGYLGGLGGLMAYSFDLKDVGRRAARQIAESLKGANPGELPFYQQTKFELIINLRTAKALGLDLPARRLGAPTR
jgi:hypothetical protein